MNWIVTLDNIDSATLPLVGGKAYALAYLARNGFKVPPLVSVTTQAYNHFVSETGLRETIALELNRKSFADMRWEEIWDAALRIRNLFLTKAIPPDLQAALSEGFSQNFDRQDAVVVRSSAPGEDAAGSSFAGLHESYVNIKGAKAVLHHIRLVWASLWSDAALLYRQELGLDIETSAMAVIIQKIVAGRCSGVAFTQSPTDDTQAVIEAVYGLNQGLVDGDIAPDRWTLNRRTGQLLAHSAAKRDVYMAPDSDGIKQRPLASALIDQAPLNSKNIKLVFDTAQASEQLFDSPQDVEWTFDGDMLYVLQSRPITTLHKQNEKDSRSWYLSLSRSFENLKSLRQQIESKLIPEMIAVAAFLAETQLSDLANAELAKEIEHRQSVFKKWVDVYWAEFIPFAHGVRLFGQIYNDAVCPTDPYEFMDLLGATQMLSLERNQLLEELADIIRQNPAAFANLETDLANDNRSNLDASFLAKLHDFTARFSEQTFATDQKKPFPAILINVIKEMATRPPAAMPDHANTVEQKIQHFFSKFSGPKLQEAKEMLDLARASYQLRDDDNIYLDRIEACLQAALDEGSSRLKNRLQKRANPDLHEAAKEVVRMLRDPHYVPRKQPRTQNKQVSYRLQARQLIGQPAGPGLAKGSARVVVSKDDLAEFKNGEVLICDAVDPNMTFVVPLASAVVERRGGMLIHGAIIAREYGLPCVTGVPDLTRAIRSGDPVTVDGYLGIVTIG